MNEKNIERLDKASYLTCAFGAYCVFIGSKGGLPENKIILFLGIIICLISMPISITLHFQKKKIKKMDTTNENTQTQKN